MRAARRPAGLRRAWLMLAMGCATAGATPAKPPAPEALQIAPFGNVTVYPSRTTSRDLVLFVSGDGGWNLGVLAMAQRLTTQGAMVAGIDIRHYLAQLESQSAACVSPSEDLAGLARTLTMRAHLDASLAPTLVGYSSGATLVYAALAQAAPGVFKGALSIAFCPDLDLRKPLCAGAGIGSTPRLDLKGQLRGVDFLPALKLGGRWVSLQGDQDQVCPAPATQRFIAKVPQGEIVMLPHVGHGYSVEKNWLPQYLAAFERIVDPR